MHDDAFDGVPYHDAKIRLHNQNMECRTKREAPSEKDPKVRSYIFNGERKRISPQVFWSYLGALWSNHKLLVGPLSRPSCIIITTKDDN
jgi:hypothetical protein